MAQPEFYPHRVEEIRQRQTHISRVFLTGPYVYKVKKAVDLEFLDFSSLEKRRHFCRREVELNRRLAADIYLEVVPIVRQGEGFAAGGEGEALEYAVKMRQLPQDASMLQQLRQQRLGKEEIENLARLLVRFYETAERDSEIDAIGTWDTVRYNCEENFRQLEPFVAASLDAARFNIVRAATRAFLIRNRTLFNRRVETGKIRDCHGDLRCGHVYFTEGAIYIIDCIEFNDRFRYADAACDLAFLAMDLDFEGFAEISGSLVEAHVGFAEDPDAYPLLDFYKCYRAMVRAKVACLRMREIDESEFLHRRTRREAQRFLELAYRYAVAFSRPTIWVICGLPASGKSTIAAALGDALNCRVLRSDVIRKQQFGMRPAQSAESDFESGIYSREATARTYAKLILSAQDTLAAGNSVILDAAFGDQDRRLEVIRLARDADADYLFVECRAPEALLEQRLRSRETRQSVSDARFRHLADIRQRFDPLDDVANEHRLAVDTRHPLAENLHRILQLDYAHLCREISRKAGF